MTSSSRLRLKRCHLDQEEVSEPEKHPQLPNHHGDPCLLNTCHWPGTVLSPLGSLTFFILATIPFSWDYCYHHSAEKKTKVPRGKVTQAEDRKLQADPEARLSITPFHCPSASDSRSRIGQMPELTRWDGKEGVDFVDPPRG